MARRSAQTAARAGPERRRDDDVDEAFDEQGVPSSVRAQHDLRQPQRIGVKRHCMSCILPTSERIGHDAQPDAEVVAKLDRRAEASRDRPTTAPRSLRESGWCTSSSPRSSTSPRRSIGISPQGIVPTTFRVVAVERRRDAQPSGKPELGLGNVLPEVVDQPFDAARLANEKKFFAYTPVAMRRR